MKRSSGEELSGASKADAAEYIANLLDELVLISDGAKLGHLSYLLEIARIEAKQLAETISETNPGH